MKTDSQAALSRYICIISMLVMAWSSFVFYPRWQQKGSEAAISWDVAGYYWYLPSVFIYKDIRHQGFADSIMRKYNPVSDLQQAYKLPNGNYVLKYSSGMAVMYLPFFAVAHVAAGVLGYPQDGFSPPYQLAIQLGGLLMSVIGLWYLRKLLLRFYPDKVVAIVLALLVIGTNYLDYSCINNGMTHTWLFTVYVFLLLNTVHFYETFRLKYALRIGALLGLATLTRPTEALAALIPLLWGMERMNAGEIKGRLLLLRNKAGLLLAAVGIAAAVVSIQLFYWRWVSGHWLVYSYQDQHLYFRSPNFMNYTFSCRNGWLRYTPMMMLAFAGLIPFWLKGRNKVAITSFFLLNYYIVCAWNIWWYGGRAMVQSYPVLMFPLAALVAAAFSRRWLAVLLVPIAALFVYMNIWYTYQSHRGTLIDTETMTDAYYWRVAGRWSAPEITQELRDGAEVYEGIPNHEQLLWQTGFEQDTAIHNTLPAIEGARSLQLDSTTRNLIEFKFPYAGGPVHWLMLRADMRCVHRENGIWKMAQVIARAYKGGRIVKERMIRVYRLLDDGQTRTIPMYMNVQGLSFDTLSVSFWNGYSNKPLLIDNVRVSSFNGGGDK